METKQTWRSTKWGEAFTRTAPWALTLDGDKITFGVSGELNKSSITSVKTLGVQPGRFWSSVTYMPDGTDWIIVDGIPNAEAKAMEQALCGALREYERIESKRQRIQKFEEFFALLVSWCDEVRASIHKHDAEHRWISEDTLQEWIRARPVQPVNFSFAHLLLDPDIKEHFDAKHENERAVLKFWGYDLRQMVNDLNDQHLQKESIECEGFLSTVEKSPLTDDQTLAVLCFDNRILTIAAAGSGKTSTMVAKAGYAVHRGLVDPERILLLAFNSDAAEELQKRIVERLTPRGIAADKIQAQTFHAFGLAVIGKATGKKPRLAPWLDKGQDIGHLSKLIDTLKDSDKAFRTKWDLFRVVFSRDLPSLDKEEQEEPDVYDHKTKKNRFKTLDGGTVKSHSERLIADWLFYNGVKYEYETIYEIDTADPEHGPYTPDFYYPDIKLYHEHFALDENGNAPAEFKGYVASANWKRELHAKHKTDFVETTSAEIRSGRAFAVLGKALAQRGIVLDPNPDRPVEGQKIIEHRDLVKVFRTFLTHAKGNTLTSKQLRARLSASHWGAFLYRHEMFLDLYEKIRAAWDASLQAGGFIDFEDMLNLAADHLEAGRWESPYDLVMVDEFQDSSKARARLVHALVNKHHKFLFAVGDDWQGINRFSGADISVMTEFEQWFGKAQTIRLQRTFRCPQSLCDISSSFVQQNPAQIPKSVNSTTKEYPPSVCVLQVKKDDAIKDAIDVVLERLCQSIASGEIPQPVKGKVSVFVLGRYNKDRQYLPEDYAAKYGHILNISFNTVHGSKGLEADYVVLPRVVRGRKYPFPSSMGDDPVMQLAMPSGDSHPHAEERRLFYVALTRAKRSAIIMTVEGRMSPFVGELVIHNGVEVVDMDGKPTKERLCPKCKAGSLLPKSGQYGPYDQCNDFPRCRYRISTKPAGTKQAPAFKKFPFKKVKRAA